MSASPDRARTPLTGASSVGAVIDEFLQATDPAGERRELRAALSHVDAELGTMRLRTVRPRHVDAMLDDLERAGLSPRREAAIVDALHAVYAFALERRLVAVDPLGEPERRTSAPRPRREPARRRPRATPTPTLTMLALGGARGVLDHVRDHGRLPRAAGRAHPRARMTLQQRLAARRGRHAPGLFVRLSGGLVPYPRAARRLRRRRRRRGVHARVGVRGGAGRRRARRSSSRRSRSSRSCRSTSSRCTSRSPARRST